MIIFYITYFAAIFCAIFYPDYIIDNSNPYADPITLGIFCWVYIVIGGVWWLRQYRHHPIIGPIYRIVGLFFIVLFAILFANYAKKEIKEWWNKDQGYIYHRTKQYIDIITVGNSSQQPQSNSNQQHHLYDTATVYTEITIMIIILLRRVLKIIKQWLHPENEPKQWLGIAKTQIRHIHRTSFTHSKAICVFVQ